MVCLQCMGNPGIFVLDDPFIGLDTEATEDMTRILIHQKKNSSVILITNILEKIMQISDKIAILENG